MLVEGANDVKAQCASMTLYHFETGHHREVCIWHDQDHKPEVVGTTPGIFISQRWVAPPDLKSLWPASSLDHGGGEYVNLYWTTTTPEQLEKDFQLLGNRLEAVGRMQPMRYIQRTWGGRLRPVSAMTRAGLALSAEAATCAPQSVGLMLTIEQLREDADHDAYARWHETEYLPMVLETGIFTAAVKLMPESVQDRHVLVVLYYSEYPDPCEAYREYQRVAAGWRSSGKDFVQADQVHQLIHQGMYRPSIGHYEFYP
jgi:hypothetical protein